MSQPNNYLNQKGLPFFFRTFRWSAIRTQRCQTTHHPLLTLQIKSPNKNHSVRRKKKRSTNLTRTKLISCWLIISNILGYMCYKIPILYNRRWSDFKKKKQKEKWPVNLTIRTRQPLITQNDKQTTGRFVTIWRSHQALGIVCLLLHQSRFQA